MVAINHSFAKVSCTISCSTSFLSLADVGSVNEEQDVRSKKLRNDTLIFEMRFTGEMLLV
jgi:hypothetical protein